MDFRPVHVDDALDRTHQKTLHLVVILGDDHKGGIQIIQPRATGRTIEVKDRQGASADVSDPPHHRVQFGHGRQTRALQYFLDLENVDAIQLIARQAKQQQFESVLPNQLRPLID